MPREKGEKVVARNKKALHDYNIGEKVEAGMVLTGTEVKSLRAGRASLADGFATVDGGQVWLRNVHIPEYEFGTFNNHAAKRKRKLLLHKNKFIGWRGQLPIQAGRWFHFPFISKMVTPKWRSPSVRARKSGISVRLSPLET